MNKRRKGLPFGRKETVNARLSYLQRTSVSPGSHRRDPASGCLDHDRAPAVFIDRSDMSVVVYIVLTVAIFALLGLIQKLVEGL